MNIAVIPARSTSKRIPGKNIRPFLGKPIIQYSIDIAIESGLFKKVIVSTDSKQIADLATRCGAEVPFIRPDDISGDLIPLTDVVHHALSWFLKEGETFEYACCLLATAPFVQSNYLKQGLDIIKEKKVSSVITVTSFPFPIFRALKITDSGVLKMFWPEHEFTRSNDLPEAYHDAGQFYWLNAEIFLKHKTLYTSDAIPIIIPRFMAQDIDSEDDWKTAEKMYQSIIFNKNNGENE